MKFSAVQKTNPGLLLPSVNLVIKSSEEYDTMQMLWFVNTKGKRSLIIFYWRIAAARQSAGPQKESARQYVLCYRTLISPQA